MGGISKNKKLLLFAGILGIVIISVVSGVIAGVAITRNMIEPKGERWVYKKESRDEIEEKYKHGMTIYRENGSKEALLYFENEFEATGSLEYLYGIAWLETTLGDPAEGERLSLFILDHHPALILQARCHYLLGFLYSDKRKYDDALFHFRKALDSYSYLGIDSSIYKCHVGIAAVRIFEKKYDEAEYALNLAIRMKSETQNLGYYYHLKSRLAFCIGNFEAGLSFAENEVKEYRRLGNKVRIGIALASQALFQGLTGRINECESDTNKAEEMLREAGGEPLILVFLNRVLIEKCRGNETSILAAELREKIDPSEQFYSDVLDFIEGKECL